MFEALRDFYVLQWDRFRTGRLVMWVMRWVMVFLITLKSLFLRVRMSHENGLVSRGRLVILETPGLPENSFFTPGRVFPCRLRHASVSFLDDAGLVVRSASLKFADDAITSPFDLLMNNGVAAPFWNMDTFWQFTRAKIWGGREKLIDYFRRNPRCYMNVRAAVRRDPQSFAHLHYFSQTPLRFTAADGKERYAKFRLIPKPDAAPHDGIPDEADLTQPWFQEALSHEPRSRNYLKDEYRARLEKGPVHYVLQIQLLEWTDACSRDVELNSLFPWDEARCPWLDLAEVTITGALGYHEGNLCLFTLAHLPRPLSTIPPLGYTDGPSIDYLRLGGIWPRKARLFAYGLMGQNRPIPDERPETAADYADRTTSTLVSDDIYMRATLPQTDTPKRQADRAAALEIARGKYQFAHGFYENDAASAKTPFTPPPWYSEVFHLYDSGPRRRATRPEPLPPFVRRMPPEENYTAYIAGRLYKIVGATIASLLLSWVEGWLKSAKGFAVYRMMLWMNRDKPLSMARWDMDTEFARQRLDGLNPRMIRRFDSLPAHFPVTDEVVAGLLDPGDTLAAAMAAHRLYGCDYAILKGISVKEGRFLTQPLVLFYVGRDGQMRPIAIQLFQTPEQGPIFTPRNPPGTWLAAKTYVQTADAQVHEVIEHLLHGHLIVEVFDVAMNRTLPQAHPVHQMLAPHFEFTMAVNTSARTKMLAPDGPIDKTMAIGAKGAFELLARGWWEHWDFAHHNVPADLAARGVADASALPHYHWRDDALELWAVVGRYAAAMVDHFYPDDAAVRDDPELQAFHAELRSERGGSVRGLPGGEAGFADRATLTETLTRLIYAASAGHAAGNNGQYDYYGFIPNTPGALYAPPPIDTTDPWDEGRLVAALPGFKAAAIQIVMVRLLSRRTEMPLGQMPHSYFAANDDVLPILGAFRRDLHDLSAKIATRNAGLEIPYTYLDPKQVARSITA